MNSKQLLRKLNIGALLVILSITSVSYAQNNGPGFLAAPVLDDSSSVGGIWFEDFFPYTTAVPITLSTRTGNETTEMQAEATVPLFFSPSGDRLLSTTLVLNRSGANDSSSVGANYRWLTADESMIVGFRIHGDFTDTASGNQFGQLGLGFDLFTNKGIDFHGNLYLAENDSKITDRLTQRTRTQDIDFSDPFATGNEIQQIKTTNIVDVLNEYEFREVGRRGGDLRAVVDVPVVSDFIATRMSFGGYHYEGNFGGADLTGLLAGIQFFPFRGVVVGADYYGHEELHGDNWFFSGGVTIPVEGENFFDPREWGRGLAKAFSQRPKSRQSTGREYMQAKMLTGPVRESRMTIEQSGPLLVNSFNRSQSSTETKVIASDIVFVNNGAAVGNGILAGSAAGTGTAERPVDTIQAGANIVQTGFGGIATVYTQATGTTYAEDVVVDSTGTNLASGTISTPRVLAGPATQIVFTSSFVAIAACDGKSFGGNTPRVNMDGGFAFDTVQSATVQGYSITTGLGFNPSGLGGFGTGIAATDVSQFTADRNMISSTGDRGIAIESDIATLVNVTDNVVSLSSNTALEMSVGASSGNLNVTVTGNEFLDAGDDGVFIDIDTDGVGTTSSTLISGNTILRASSTGIDIDTSFNNGSTNTVTVSSNMVSNSGNDALEVDSDVGSGANGSLLITGNTFLNAGATGVQIDADWDTTGTVSLNLSNNRIEMSNDDGFDLHIDPSATNQSGIIAGNAFINNGGDSIELTVHLGAPMPFSGTGNTSVGAGSGLMLNDGDTSDATGSIEINGTVINFPSPGNIAE